MADIAILVAEEYERRINNTRKNGGGGRGGGEDRVELGFFSSVSATAMKLEASSLVKKVVGEENLEFVKWVLEPKSQIGVAAINGFFSA